MGQNIPPAPFSSASQDLAAKSSCKEQMHLCYPLHLASPRLTAIALLPTQPEQGCYTSTLSSTLQPRKAAKSLITPCSRTRSGLGPAVLPNGPLASQCGGRNSLITGVILPVPSLPLKAGAVLPCWLKAWVATGQSRKSHRGKLNLVSCGTESLLQPWTNPPDVSLPLLARPDPHSHTHGPSAKPSPAAPSPASADGTSGTSGDNSPQGAQQRCCARSGSV